jgi:hypothetical protein
MSAATPEGTPEGTPTEEGGGTAVAALEGRLEQLQNLVQSQGDATGQIGQLMQGLQGQLSQLTSQNAANDTSRQSAEPSEEFQKFYQDMPGYIRKQALESTREALGPHLAHQAVQARDTLMSELGSQIDEEHGEGFFAEHMAESVTEALGRIPLEMQASKDHIEAVVGAAMGRLYLNPESRQLIESGRAKATKAREEAMNNLPGGRPMPKIGDKLDDRQRGFLDTLARNGISFSEAEYKTAMKAGNDIDSWQAAKAAAKGKK